ncbi:glycosyltransferase family 4 protein [Caulobacter sp. S45]|uniref:glycosyltransferase family 4 protein n=1 Tax=Caulobacter sp. S45 TaxID=1641861 RepID=UPI001575DBAF|nr:glycosyltransferase family 4 protein [Caulobacter sp. S45]
MRVCFVSRRFFPAVSGMSIYATNLLREMVAAGHDVTLVSQFYGGGHASVYGGGPPPPVPGVRVIGLEALGEQDGGDFERDIVTLADTIVAEHAERPFDILHAQYAYPTGWATLLTSRRTGVPNLVSVQGGDGHWVGSCCETHRLAMVRTLDHAGALLIGGESFRDEVCERLGTSPGRFTLVPGAVDTAQFHPADGERPPGPLRILYHGRVDRRKGVLDFLEALHSLDRPELAWCASISGIGPDLEPARALAAERGLTEDRLRFLGYVAYDAAPEVYRAHDLFASPTYSEGFSNTILEAMASGLPVLSCRAVGVVDCLRDGETSLLVEPGDVAAQAGALERLLSDAALRARLADAALAECRRTYSWTAVGREIMAVYHRLAGTSPDADFDPALPLTPCRFRDAPHLL